MRRRIRGDWKWYPKMTSGDGDRTGSGLKLMGEVPRVNASEYSYELFWKEYMRANKPVLLTGLMNSWRSCKDWVLESGAPNLPFIADNFGKSRVQVADCGRKEFTDQKKQEMTVQQFVQYWQELNEDSSPNPNRNSNSKNRLLYLKDWHFVKDFPAYCAYKTPEAFSDDWLNTYLDAFEMHSVSAEITPKSSSDDNQCSDYRFVYMGPKGTWTPLHADVLRSYSWSANVCGRKQWLLLSPEQVHLVCDRFQRDTVYDIYSEVSAQQFPGFCQARWVECNQGPGEILFVPSGWFHQVTNVEDTISINHNWLNACNLHWAWKLLKKEYRETVESIEDIRSIADDFEMLCQRNLAANAGMNYLDFAIFVAKMVDSSVKLLSSLSQESFGKRERLMVMEESESLEWHIWKNTADQCLFNIQQMKKILEELIHEDVFQLEDNFSVVFNCKLRFQSDNLTAFSEKVLEHTKSPEICFISEYLSKFFSHKDTVSGNLLETPDGYRDDGLNHEAEIDNSYRKQSTGGVAGPSFMLKNTQYILDVASRAGIMSSDIENCSITLPVTLTVDTS